MIHNWRTVAVSTAATVALAVQEWGRERKHDGARRIGDEAKTFKLKSMDGKSESDLASFRGKRPVVLFFGSYT